MAGQAQAVEATVSKESAPREKVAQLGGEILALCDYLNVSNIRNQAGHPVKVIGLFHFERFKTMKKPRTTKSKKSPRKAASDKAPATGSWRDMGLSIHPAANEFPLLSEIDPKALRAIGEDIKQNGMQLPIIVVADPDSNPASYSLFDGRNRLDAMELVGIDFKLFREKKDGFWNLKAKGIDLPYVPIVIKSCEDPAALVASLNVHRRHLTAEQKRKVIAKLLTMSPEKSDRTIAETVKADHKTVAAVRKEKEGRGEIPHVEKRTDSKGRSQPATRAKTTAKGKGKGNNKPQLDLFNPKPDDASRRSPLPWLNDSGDLNVWYVISDDEMYRITPNYPLNEDDSVASFSVEKVTLRPKRKVRNLVPKNVTVTTIEQAKQLAQADFDRKSKTSDVPAVEPVEKKRAAREDKTIAEQAARSLFLMNCDSAAHAANDYTGPVDAEVVRSCRVASESWNALLGRLDPTLTDSVKDPANEIMRLRKVIIALEDEIASLKASNAKSTIESETEAA